MWIAATDITITLTFQERHLLVQILSKLENQIQKSPDIDFVPLPDTYLVSRLIQLIGTEPKPLPSAPKSWSSCCDSATQKFKRDDGTPFYWCCLCGKDCDVVSV